MSLHLGDHWNMIMGIVRKLIKSPIDIYIWILRVVAVLIAGYGVYAFIHRKIGRYMLMMDHFVFFDIDEPLVFFMVDYAAVMALFVFFGHYFTFGLKQIQKIKIA